MLCQCRDVPGYSRSAEIDCSLGHGNLQADPKALLGLWQKERKDDDDDGGSSATSASDASSLDVEDDLCSSFTGHGAAKFHFVPANGWHPDLCKMHCSARNTIEWAGKGPVPSAPCDCWLLPTSDKMAVRIAQLQAELVEAGWKVLTCHPRTVQRLSNKAKLYKHARALCIDRALPRHYDSPEAAEYPCILKASVGQHGKDVFIVNSIEEVLNIAAEGFGDNWLLQELVAGVQEYSTSLLVEGGRIIDAICTEYEYDRPAYVWPNVDEVSRRSHSDIPRLHLDTMVGFLKDYSGICNFNYKIRPTGGMCIFEINTRVGADLACDVPRSRARILFQKLDQLSPVRNMLGKN
mmetsp:Transcript_36949/g.106410  ORF Transcript_36949/g.106410 Transcript_36949/m.106410 type:complete len:350 (-) Transcript_36949:163-1212(-)